MLTSRNCRFRACATTFTCNLFLAQFKRASVLCRWMLEYSLIEECTEVSGALGHRRPICDSRGQVGVLCTTSAWFCKCILPSRMMLHRGWGARDRQTVWMVAEMLATEVLFEVAASRESLLAISDR